MNRSPLRRNMPSARWSLIGLWASLSMALPAEAQEVLLELQNAQSGMLRSVIACDDIDGDGHPDLVVGPSGYATMLVVSGASGAVVRQVTGVTGTFGLTGSRVGDFDADGVPDFALGEYNYPGQVGDQRGRILVFSGATGAVLAEIQGPALNSWYGFNLSGIGDVDGDGFADVAFSGFYGDVHIHRGPDGAHLRSHQGPGTRPAVAGIGDVDGDGHPDYVVGWCQDSQGGLWAGTAVVYSGRTGAVIHQVFGSIPQNRPHSTGDHLGRAVAGSGDVDGDGIPDFICGAPGEIDWNWDDLQSRVLVFSGADASLLLELDGRKDGSRNSWFGGVLAGGKDVNGDGVPDILVGAPNERGPFAGRSGCVNVYSGCTGTRLWKVFTQNNAGTGHFIALVGDFDGDGLSEFASSDSRFNNYSGRILVWSGFPADAEELCPGDPNSQGVGARLELGGDLGIGSDWHTRAELIASGVPAGTPGLFFYGVPRPPLPLGEGSLCVGAPSFRLGPPIVADSSGTLRRELHFDQPPVNSGPGQLLAGTPCAFQLWYRDPTGGPAGHNLSAALRVTFAP